MGVRLLQSAQGVGIRVDRYDLVAELASGGMATVYLARLSAVGGFQRTFALKRLHPHLAGNADFVQMFLDEARLAALIRHPNVVPILEVGQGAEGYYLVMEYIEGDTFATLLSKTSARGRRIPIGVTLRIVIDMLQGLHAAHELQDEHGRLLGLVHRDVSPQNVMVGTDGITRITDFGVARAASALSQTKSGQLKGKLAYMAPEQASGREDVDRRVDVFAAGVVMWEALAFKRLFKSDNEAATLSRVLSEPIVSPMRHNPEVAPEVAQVCLQALERDANRRFVSCAEFASALERAALARGQLATVKDVADYVQDVVGSDMESHRVAIRQWLQLREQSGGPPASVPSLPPSRELSSVTLTSRVPPPPPSSRGSLLARPAVATPLPASATHSGVIVAPAARRNKLVATSFVLLLLAGIGAAAWVVTSQPSAPQPSPTLGSVAAVQSASAQTAAAEPTPSEDTSKPVATDENVAPGTAISSDELPPADDETESESAAAAEKAPASTAPSRGPRKPARTPPAKKKGKSLPNLDNPYQ